MITTVHRDCSDVHQVGTSVNDCGSSIGDVDISTLQEGQVKERIHVYYKNKQVCHQ